MDLSDKEYQAYVESLKHPDMEVIRKRIKESISETDIYQYFGYTFNVKEDVITYSDLEQFDNIEQVLEHDKAWKIILIEEEENFGHWVVIMRYGKTIEHFNSYGSKPSYELDLLSDKKNDELGQDDKYLNRLLTLALGKYKVVYNKKQFQMLENNINTCGRFVVLRLITMQYYNMDLSKFIKYMEQLKKHYKMTYDEIVALLIIT